MSEIRVKSTGTIKLFESDNTSHVTIASPASLSANRTITIPDADVTLGAGTTINNNADNRVITGSGTANTLEGESGLTYNGETLTSTDGASGASANSGAKSFVADSNSASGNGISILSKNNATGRIKFGDSDSNSRFEVGYNHSTEKFQLNTANAISLAINQDGIITKPLQPCFIVKAVSQTNVTGNGTSYNVAFTSEIKDIGSNFSGTTFTAPITGSYILTGHVDFQGGNNNITNTFLHFETSNRDFPVYTIKGGAGGGTGTQAGILYGTGDGQGMGLGGSCIADMDANDTVYLRLTVQGAGSDQCDITANNTIFTGCLLA